MELIGLCLAPLDDERRGRLVQLAEQTPDLGRLFDLSTSRMCSPMVYRRLQETGLDARMTAEVRDRFESILRREAIHNAARLRSALAVSDALLRSGVEVVFFKGASLLLSSTYPDFGYRPMSDVDLLARPGDRSRVIRTFETSGEWRRLPDQVMQEWSVSAWVDRLGGMVEAHWNLKPGNGAASGQAEARLFAHARPLEVRGKRALVPSWEDCFIQAALHGTSHHYFDSSYLFLGVADLAYLASAANGVDWDRMLHDLSAERMLEHAAVALELGCLLTDHPPLRTARQEFAARRPELFESCAPFARALSEVTLKPWTFHSFHERRLLSPKSPRDWLRYVYHGLKRRLPRDPALRRSSLAPKDPPDRAASRTRFLDPEYLRYLIQLFRFDRRIRYKFTIGPKPDVPPDEAEKEPGVDQGPAPGENRA